MARTTFSGPVKSIAGFIFGEGSQLTKALKVTATLDFPSITAQTSSDLTVSVPGAAIGDTVTLSLPAAINAGLTFNAFVSATDVVTVRATNSTAGALNPASASYTVIVFA